MFNTSAYVTVYADFQVFPIIVPFYPFTAVCCAKMAFLSDVSDIYTSPSLNSFSNFVKNTFLFLQRWDTACDKRTLFKDILCVNLCRIQVIPSPFRLFTSLKGSILRFSTTCVLMKSFSLNMYLLNAPIFF